MYPAIEIALRPDHICAAHWQSPSALEARALERAAALSPVQTDHLLGGLLSVATAGGSDLATYLTTNDAAVAPCCCSASPAPESPR